MSEHTVVNLDHWIMDHRKWLWHRPAHSPSAVFRSILGVLGLRSELLIPRHRQPLVGCLKAVLEVEYVDVAFGFGGEVLFESVSLMPHPIQLVRLCSGSCHVYLDPNVMSDSPSSYLLSIAARFILSYASIGSKQGTPLTLAKSNNRIVSPKSVLSLIPSAPSWGLRM